MEQLLLAQSDYLRTLGVRLRRIIMALDIPQKQAAEEMGVSPSHLGNWLRGGGKMPIYPIYRFMKVRGVSADYLFLGDPAGLRKELADRLLPLELQPEVRPARGRRARETAKASV